MKRWTMVLVAALLLFSLACAGLGGGSDETETPVVTQEPGAVQQPTTKPTEEPTEEPVDDETLPEVDAEALKGLDSYRTTMTMRSEFEDGTAQEVSIRQEYIREPFATRMVMESVGEEEDPAAGQMEMIQVGTTQWINFGGQWMQSETTDDASSFEDSLIDYDDFTSGLEEDDYEYLGRETVNGIKTKHYRLEVTSLEALALGSDITEASSEIWIADESGLPTFTVRLIVTYKGDIEADKPGTATISQDVYDVNQDFVIEPPAEALAGGLPEDVPMYPGGTELTTMSGMISFTAPDDAATVTAFYDEALVENGWEKDAEAFMPTFQKEGRDLQLYISDEDTGGSSVVIMITEAE